MSRNLDAIATLVATMLLFTIVPSIFFFDVHGAAVSWLLLPVIAGIIGWKVSYFVYVERSKPRVMINAD